MAFVWFEKSEKYRDGFALGECQKGRHIFVLSESKKDKHRFESK